MNSLTKNIQSRNTLEQMIHKAFPHLVYTEIEELTEGYFNVAYKVCFESGEQYILKVAPPKDVPVMSYEKNIMFSEVTAMNLVAEKTGVPVARVLYFDETLTLCGSPYFFMECLPGDSLYSLRERLSEEEKKQIRIDSGRLNKKINAITGDRFGYIGLPHMQGKNWYAVFFSMIQMILKDAERMSVDLKISIPRLVHLLSLSKAIFEPVTVPRLVHWDLWDGNIFVKDRKVTGLIDWERSLWSDPLMEVGFRTYDSHQDFKKGYGLEHLSEKEFLRALWYDLYTLLIVAQECDYRQYETRDIYDFAIGTLSIKMKEAETVIGHTMF